ncbi:glycosyltransferase [Candidatus Bathyarchaeota archaeon]|nr:glycosyltransferase [Candidatus Bathyarchaeota archaeon]
MQVIILSWEYPPRVVGKLADYVRELAVRLVKNNVTVYVVTYHDFLTGLHEEPEGVRTCRITNPVKTHIGVLTWVLTLNQEAERVTANIYYDADKQINLIDAHDWHFIPAAVTLKKAFNLPFIYSIDSLEDHRSHGANSPFNMSIRSIEWLGMYEAKKILVKSEWMRDEAHRIYKVPIQKIKVVKPKSQTWMKDVLEAYMKTGGGSVSR